LVSRLPLARVAYVACAFDAYVRATRDKRAQQNAAIRRMHRMVLPVNTHLLLSCGWRAHTPRVCCAATRAATHTLRIRAGWRLRTMRAHAGVRHHYLAATPLWHSVVATTA